MRRHLSHREELRSRSLGVLVVIIVVMVVADMKVKVEEAGSELAVVVPVVERVEAEAGERRRHGQRKGCGQPPRDSNHRTAPSVQHGCGRV